MVQVHGDGPKSSSAVPNLDYSRPPPGVMEAQVSPNDKRTALIVNTGGGIVRLEGQLNGKDLSDVTADARGAAIDPNADSTHFTVDISHARRLEPGRST